MRIIVSDTNCLVDLRKASLLDVFLKLPYELLIPNTLFESELLKFSRAEKATLRAGMSVTNLPGESVMRAREVARELPHLSIHDGFVLALAEQHPGCILLTGDRGLREFATTLDMEVHGILWVIDKVHRHRLTSTKAVLAALHLFAADQTVRLPARVLAAYIKRYKAM